MEEKVLDSKSSANYHGFSLVKSGIIYSLTSVFRSKKKPETDLIRTAIVLVLITWLPLGILALYYGTLNDAGTTISFFEDFLVHVRFLFAVPFLILIEKIVDKNFVSYIKNTDKIIPESQQQKYNQLVARLVKLTTSYIPEIIVLVIYYTAIFTNPDLISAEDSGRNYLTYSDTNTLNVAGWFNFLFCIPIYLLVTFRWAWRWIIWVYSMIKISFFKIYTDPLHADNVAGLAYLNSTPFTFSFILIAPSAMLSAEIGINIIYNDVSFMSYKLLILLYVFILPIILYSPLAVFMIKLFNARKEGVVMFGGLIRKHNYNYVKKWIDSSSTNKERILGAMDNSSLANINCSYTPITEMKLIPVNYRMIVLSFIMNVIPYIPLVFTYYSFTELFKMGIKSMVGG